MSTKQTESLLKNEPLAKKLVGKSFWLYLFTFLIAPAGYLIRIMISDQFDPSDVGIIYSVISFILLLSVYNDLGLTEAMTYFLPKFWISKKYNSYVSTILSTFCIQLFTAIMIISFLFFGGSDWLAIHHFNDPTASTILDYFMRYFLGINLFQVLQGVIMSFQDVFQHKLVEFVRQFSILGFTGYYYFMVDFSTIENFALAWVAGLFVGLLVGVVLFYKKYGWTLTSGKIGFDDGDGKKFLNYAFWTFLAMNSGSLLGQIDLQMVVNLMGPESAGFYTNYNSLYQTHTLFLGPVLTLLLPVVSELVAKKMDHKIVLLQNMLYTYLPILALSYGMFLSVRGSDIATLLLGEKFSFSGELLSLGGWFVFTNIIVSIGFGLLAGLGKMRQRVFILIGSVLVNIIFNFLFIPFWGLYGVIFSTILGQFFMLICSVWQVYIYHPISVRKYFVCKNLLFLAVCCLIMFIIKNIWTYNTDIWLYNLLYLVLIGVAYYLLLLGFNFLELKKLFIEFKDSLK